MTKESNKVGNYKVDPKTFGGFVDFYDFGGYRSLYDVAKDIQSDEKFDKRMIKNKQLKRQYEENSKKKEN